METLSLNPFVVKRLLHLQNTSYALATADPKTSAHLMSQFRTLAFENNLVSFDTGNGASCAACGSLQIPGWNGHVYIAVQSNVDPKSRHVKALQSKAVTKLEASRSHFFDCYVCNSRNSLGNILKTPATRPKHIEQSVGSDDAKVGNNKASISATSPQPPSKKRQKRKRKSSLRSILAKSRDTSNQSIKKGGKGLDLLDFMKKN